VAAFDASNGKDSWRVSSRGVDGLGFAARSVGVGTRTISYSEGANPTLRTVEVSNGRELWNQQVPVGLRPDSATRTLLVLTNSRDLGSLTPYLASPSTPELRAVERSTGALGWNVTLPTDKYVRFTLAGSERGIVVGTVTADTADASTLSLLAAADGRPRWTVSVPDAVATLSVIDDVVIVYSVGFTPPQTATIRALDASSGAELWHRDAGVPGAPPIADPTTKAVAILNATYTTITSVDAKSGTERWHKEVAPDLHTPVRSVVVAGAGIIVVAQASNKLVALEARTGTPRWRAPIPAGSTSMFVGPRSVYLAGGCTAPND
jgi:outer membrane protein assembly factor BamB